jgi:hypothetical protein
MLCRVRAVSIVVVIGWFFASPAPASAQWYIGAYLGASHTHDATVSVREPGLALDFHDVKFYGYSQAPRRYYGVRLGWLGRPGRSLGVEVELIHLKAVGDTGLDYSVSAADGNLVPIEDASPMNRVVQEYQMTHGLNLALVNLVMRRPIGTAPAALMLRVGGGPSFPHAETTVNDVIAHQYEYGGLSAQGAAGVEFDLPFRTMAFAEYKLTYAHPELTTGAGTASSSALSHHIAFGVGIALTSR